MFVGDAARQIRNDEADCDDVFGHFWRLRKLYMRGGTFFPLCSTALRVGTPVVIAIDPQSQAAPNLVGGGDHPVSVPTERRAVIEPQRLEAVVRVNTGRHPHVT